MSIQNFTHRALLVDNIFSLFLSGYMSPEYALDGLFSVKSDVFSFGVVMLEIVSGTKNTGFYQSQRSLSLLGHVSSIRTSKLLPTLIN